MASTINTTAKDEVKTYTPEEWGGTSVPIKTKWAYFEENNAMYPEITTEQEWKDAGMPHPAQKVSDQIQVLLPQIITKADDMHLPDSSPEINAKFDTLYSKIQTGATTDAFESGDMDNYLPAWVALNTGKTIRVGGVAYKIKSYVTAGGEGNRSKLILEDSKGVEFNIEGTKSTVQTKKQAQDSANTDFIVNGFALGIPALVSDIQEGNIGEGVVNFLTGGLFDWIKRRR
jgi:hypothetical protein